MKLLKNEEIICQDGPVILTMNPITTSIQARLMELAIGASTIAQNVDRTRYALKEIINSIEIEGKSYNPVDLADQIDLSDPISRDIFILIGSMVMAEAFMGADTEKKSELSPKHGSLDGSVENAPVPLTGDSQTKAA